MAKVLQTIDFSEEPLCKRCHLMLRMSGDFNPQEVTDLSGITPMFSHRKGDAYQSVAGPRNRYTSHWSITSAHLESTLVEDHACELDRLLGPAENWEQVLSMEDASVAVVIWYEPTESTSDYSLPSTLLAKLSKFCHTFEFYCVGPFSEE